MQLETLGYSYQDGCIIYLSKRYVLFKNRQPVYRASSSGGGKREESKRNEKSSDEVLDMRMVKLFSASGISLSSVC